MSILPMRFSDLQLKRFGARTLLLYVGLSSFSVFFARAQSPLTPYREEGDHPSSAFFARNRQALLEQMPDSSVCVLFSAPVRNRSNDVDYVYHQDPDFLYLTGFDEKDALLFLFKPSLTGTDGVVTSERLVIHPRDADAERWTGRMATPEAAREISGVRDVSLSSDTGLFQEVFSGRYRILTKKLPQGAVNERMDEFDLFDLLKQFKEQTAAAGVKTDDFRLGKMLARLREIKSDEELVLMQKAIDISVDAHMEMMAAVRPGMFEYEVEAKGEYVFHRSGAEDVGYPSICGSAGNSVILHYDRNRRKLNDGDLILLDMGAEYHGYTADITRTLPVSGKFSPEQLQLYSLVLEAQEAGIAECRAGKEFRDPHRAALKTIEKGLIKLGIIEEEQQAREYFPHGTSHYLGLDVHDAGSFGPLQDRQVITVEPGIYIPSGSPCDPKWWGIGIRIEDDVLITPNEPVVLSGRLPKDPFLIEKLIKQGK